MKSVTLFLLFFASIYFVKAQEIQDSIPKHETFKIVSKEVGETRIINVWTPPNYAVGKDSLAVMYMADGGIKEDFPHIANTLAKLIEEKKIKPIILVGIENTERRRDLTGFTNIAEDKKIAKVVGGSAKFRAFIGNELIPEINKKYRTAKEKGIIGESLSGLFVEETFFATPDMFDFYIAFDPSLWWNDGYLAKNSVNYLDKFPKTEKRIWFASSNVKGSDTYNKQVAEALKTKNLSNVKWNYSPEPKENHATIFRATKEKAIIWTLNAK